MITALVVHRDVDWGGFVAVMGILVFALGAASWDWFRSNEDYLRASCDLVLAAVDHEQCRHDGCDVTLCYCRTPLTGRACPGAVEPGCGHVSLICDDHRVEDCEGCVEDARLDAGWYGDVRTGGERLADQGRFDTLGLPRTVS